MEKHEILDDTFRNQYLIVRFGYLHVTIYGFKRGLNLVQNGETAELDEKWCQE